VVQRTREILVGPDDDGKAHHGDEEVRREREVSASLFDATKVAVDEKEHDTAGDLDSVREEGGHGAR
jgi:hypothetical protein